MTRVEYVDSTGMSREMVAFNLLKACISEQKLKAGDRFVKIAWQRRGQYFDFVIFKTDEEMPPVEHIDHGGEMPIDDGEREVF